MQERLQAQNLDAERFSATFGKALPNSVLEQQATWLARTFCTRGMLGCFISHQRIWRRVVDEGHEAVVILEDDAVLCPEFAEKVQLALAELPGDWDVCLLGAVGCVAREREPLNMKAYSLIAGGARTSPGKTRGISQRLFVPHKPAGTHAYVVSLRGAAKLLELLPKARYHVDLSAWSLEELRLYASKEFLAHQEANQVSTVQKEGEPVTQRFLKWLLEISGIAYGIRQAGVPNFTWAWRTAIYALPVWPGHRLVLEAGPMAAFWVILILLAVAFRSPLLAGISVAYCGINVCVIRLLAGTFSLRVFLFHALLSAGLIASSFR